jgi:integrase
LARYRSERSVVLDRLGGSLSDTSFVFSHTPDGSEPWKPNYVTLAFTRIATRVGLGSLHLHSLRHFAATTMLVNGVDVRTAAGRLGHAQTSMTLDTYAHFVQSADTRAAATLGDALDAGTVGFNDHRFAPQ